jgi:hypothetical protein
MELLTTKREQLLAFRAQPRFVVSIRERLEHEHVQIMGSTALDSREITPMPQDVVQQDDEGLHLHALLRAR